MFDVQRQQVLDECQWVPGEGQLRYIETRTFANTDNASTDDTYREGDLSDLEVDDWLHQRGRFVRPTNSRLGKEEGSIKLLVCERVGFQPFQFGLSKASFLAVEEKYGLPTEMLPFFKFNGGGHSYYFRHSASHDSEQLVITIKVPQMYQIANYGLCLTHSFKTHVTFGFMFGWNMFHEGNWKRCMSNVERPEHLGPHGPRISKLIKSTSSYWRHPLLLPVILLEDHVYNADRYKGRDLSIRTTELEKQLGVTKSGRSVNSSGSFNVEELDRKTIITKINTTVTDAVTLAGNLRWNIRYCQFLRDISRDIRDLIEPMQGREPKLDYTIETLASLVISILEHTEAIKARLDIQLNVLYNLFAQVDSNVNSTIAATTGLDSAAMKALAFVTTLFLPPTFIATLFSSSMFDWQADVEARSSDSNEGTKVVSRHFWVYWVVSVPLSVVVFLIWRIWWHREKNHYRQNYHSVKLDRIVIDRGPSLLNRLTRLMLERKRVNDIEFN